MVRNYIVDSVLYWHNEYHIDGFRFDLVGLLDAVTINEIVEEVHKCDPDIIFYGEGWYMQNNTAVEERLIECKGMADQGNSSRTPNFAYFSDTVRDALSGRDTNKNGFIFGVDKTDTMLACFKAQPGWTSNPSQTINYASCHDNYTLMDKVNNYFGLSNLSYETFAPTEEHAKVNNLAAAYYLFAEGIPLIHAGEEMLRIKLEEHEDGTEGIRMKKLRYVVLLLVVMVVLAGCRKDKQQAGQEIQNQTPEVEFGVSTEQQDEISTEAVKENVTGTQGETPANTEAEASTGAQGEISTNTEAGNVTGAQREASTNTEAGNTTGTQGGAPADTETGVSTETTEQESTEVIELPFVPVG